MYFYYIRLRHIYCSTSGMEIKQVYFHSSQFLRIFVVDLNNLSDYQLFIKKNSHENGQRIRKYQTVQTIISLMFSNNSLYNVFT